MPNANWALPTTTSLVTTFPAEIRARDEDLACQFNPLYVTTATAFPTGTIRWNNTLNRWQVWSGTAWGELTATYALTGLSTTGAASIGTTLTVTGTSTFTGIPSGPTAGAGTNTQQLATTAFVATAVAAKANLAGPTFTGAVVLPSGTAVTAASQPALSINSTAAGSWKSLLTFSSSGTRKWEVGVDFSGAGDNNLYFYDNAAAASRAMLTSTGYFKASPTGTFANITSAGTNHEFHSTVTPLLLRNFNATAGKWWFVGPDTFANNITVYNQNSVGMYMVDGAVAWTGTSDERRKDIIEPISDALEKVSSLRAVIGKFKVDPVGTRRSFLIAQDVQAVLPEAVDVQGDPDGTLGLAYSDVIPLLVAALKESTLRIEEMEERLALLESP